MANSTTTASAFRELAERYTHDADFRSALQRDPVEAIRVSGLDIPLTDAGDGVTLGTVLADLPPDAVDPTIRAVASLISTADPRDSDPEPQGVPTVWAFIIAIANANAVGNANATANANVRGYHPDEPTSSIDEITVELPSGYSSSTAHAALTGLHLSEARQATLLKQAILSGDSTGPDESGTYKAFQSFRGVDLYISYEAQAQCLRITSVDCPGSSAVLSEQH